MFEANNLNFNPNNIVFTEELQRELFLFKLNQNLPVDQQINIDNLEVLKDKDKMKNIFDKSSDIFGGKNTVGQDLSNLDEFLMMTDQGEKTADETDQNIMNLINVPGKNKNVSSIDGNSESASIKISTNYKSNDGVKIDNFHNLQQYNSPAVFIS